MTGGGIERVFLGWDGPVLPRAAEFLWQRFGPDFKDVRVAVPGRRAGRRLEELLLDLATAADQSAWCPPSIEAVGTATDALVSLRHPVAGSLARELAWLKALTETDPTTLQRLSSASPDHEEAQDPARWLGFAELIRNLHGEVVGEAYDFADIAKSDALPAGTDEVERWNALEIVQQAYRKVLAADRLEDPHLRRLDALRERRVAGDEQLVLLGIADLNRLQQGILRTAAEKGSSLLVMIAAPESESSGFDELGCLRAEAWAQKESPVPDEGWRIVERPTDQAEAAVEALAELGAERAADELVLCAASADLLPSLRRSLVEAGAGLRSPVGPILEETAPFRLLAALADFLSSRSPESFGELLRHADFEDAAGDLHRGAIKELDAYLASHLPQRLDSPLLGSAKHVERLSATLGFLDDACAGTLAVDVAQTLSAIGADIRRFLERIYSAREFDRSKAAPRVCAAAIEKLLGALDEVDHLPEGIASLHMQPASFLRIFLRHARNQPVTPAPARERDIEQLGWLDLALDDAPVVVAAGMQHGLVPATLHGHAFLPDTVRTQLGMQDQASRVARDLHALCVIHHSRTADGGLRLIAGLQSPTGDPWLPSELYFRCADDQLVGRTAAAFEDEPDRPVAPIESSRSLYTPPTAVQWSEPEHYSASALNLYLSSPYAYYLKYILKLSEPDDAGEELDALRFGSLLHDVLEGFGEDEALRDCTDVDRISAALHGQLDDIANRAFGSRRRATVTLQLLQAKHRLNRFAEIQAHEVREGWRIQAAEWQPENDGVAEVEVGGQQFRLKGKIDRIERHVATGAWRVLDYKTGENPRKGAASVYGKQSETWKDLQLPLYRHLSASYPELRGDLALGYFNLPKSAESAGIWVGDKEGFPFDEPTLQLADEQIGGIVHDIRQALVAQDVSTFLELGKPWGGGLAAMLAGANYLAAAEEEDE